MESNHSMRSSKFLRALLILLFMAAPIQWTVAQLTISTPRTNLGTVIKQIKSQSKYQFFYNDKLSTIPVEPLTVTNASLESVLNSLLKGKNVTFKVEDNIVYLSESKDAQATQQKKERTVKGQVLDSKGEKHSTTTSSQKNRFNEGY